MTRPTAEILAKLKTLCRAANRLPKSCTQSVELQHARDEIAKAMPRLIAALEYADRQLTGNPGARDEINIKINSEGGPR